MKTVEEKARAYDEALEKAKNEINAKGIGDTVDLCKHLFPELRESDDERIRKFIQNELVCLRASEDNGSDRYNELSSAIAYLEKQKDTSKAIEAVERIDKYIDQQVANAHDMEDSNPDKKYYLGWDDALGEISGILQDVYSDEKQKEHQNKSDALGKALGRDLTFPQDKDKNLDEIAQDYVDGVKEYNPEPTWDLLQTAVCYGYHYCEQKPEQYDIDVLEKHITKDSISELAHTVIVRNGWEIVEKEQKPDDDPLDDPKFLKGFDTGREVQRIFDEQKPAEYLDKDKVYAIMTKLTNLSYSQLIPINSDEYKQIYEITHDVRSLLDYSIKQKPAEWSEEDENVLELLHELIGFGFTEKFFDAQTAYDMRNWVNTRLKSLRPSWKPSKKQMDALAWYSGNSAIPPTGDKAIQSLYNDLKKLM